MPKPNDLSSDINFLFEMGNIRFIERMWKRFLNADFANLAEHHFRLFWIAMVIAEHESGADIGKIGKLSMIHDIAESRTGDVDYLARQYVERNEKLAIQDMLKGTVLEKDVYALWQEYEARETLEAKIVKDADNLEVDFELAEQASHGNRLQELWVGNRTHVAEAKLYTDTAKAIAKQLRQSDPHAWHNLGRNRRNDGDWRSS